MDFIGDMRNSLLRTRQKAPEKLSQWDWPWAVTPGPSIAFHEQNITSGNIASESLPTLCQEKEVAS
jgi:hypothetical protein